MGMDHCNYMDLQRGVPSKLEFRIPMIRSPFENILAPFKIIFRNSQQTHHFWASDKNAQAHPSQMHCSSPALRITTSGDVPSAQLFASCIWNDQARTSCRCSDIRPKAAAKPKALFSKGAEEALRTRVRVWHTEEAQKDAIKPETRGRHP